MAGVMGARSHRPAIVGVLAAVTFLLMAAAVIAVVPVRSSPAPVPAAAAQVRSRGPYDGLGTWVDMYSWSQTFTQGDPRFGPDDIDAMAGAGVQTLYIQAASQTGPPAVLEAGRLLALIQRAHQARISVVVWYLPTLVNLADDMARLLEISGLPADGVAVDMESTDVADVGQRNAALVSLSRQLRMALPALPLGAIVLPAALLEVVNTTYWPDFPYRALAPLYDAWLPMVYWTGRLTTSGYRDGYRYTADSINRLRADLDEVPAAPPASRAPPARATAINPIGGVSVDGIGLADLNGFVTAAKETGSTGGSVYEWPGTDPAAWPVLRALRSGWGYSEK